MPFQFMCPQGHLLEGHESQMGQQVPCPVCGTLMIVPIVGANPVEAQQPGAAEQPFPGLPEAASPPNAEKEAAPAVKETPKTVRILCPNGHELHTPMDMIGMQAACPQCKAEFLLRYEDSLEYVEQKRIAREQRDAAFNQAALKWSIVAAVIVFIGLITMMILASTR